MNELFQWILAFMLAVSPPTDPGHQEAGKETPEETIQRYEEITNDIIEVAYDPEIRSLYPDHENGRSRSVAVMLGIMYHESNFYRHIDAGWKKGDSGRSWCMMQVWAGRAPRKTGNWNYVHDRPPYWGDPEHEIREGYSGPELVSNRKLCLKEGLRIARWSFRKCGNRGPLEKLRVYASGSCSKGGEASRARMGTAERFWYKSQDKITWSDERIVSELKKARLRREMRRTIQAMQTIKTLDTRFLYSWDGNAYKMPIPTWNQTQPSQYGWLSNQTPIFDYQVSW